MLLVLFGNAVDDEPKIMNFILSVVRYGFRPFGLVELWARARTQIQLGFEHCGGVYSLIQSWCPRRAN